MDTTAISALPNLWQLFAGVIALPAFIAFIKGWIPQRYHSLLAPVLAVVGNVLYALANGMDLWTAIVQGLGLGFSAAGVRNVYVKAVKKPA
jgi:hypothetical protein